MLFASIFSIQANAQQSSGQDSILTAVIRVGNLHCNGDMPTIKKNLLNQEGIDDVTFTERHSESSEFSVKYHSAATSVSAIEKAIESTPGCDAPTETPYKVLHPKKKKNG